MSIDNDDNNAAGAPTPAYASYVPHDLKYDAAFEDAVMRIVLGPPLEPDGIRVIPHDSPEQPVENKSVRAADISLDSLPSICEHDLPLTLDDSRRIFASPIPGIRLTHPGGYLQGGPALDPDMDTFPDDFLANNPRIRSSTHLHTAVANEIEASRQTLRERLQARKHAQERNEKIHVELARMAEEHAMELKINKRLADERRAKKEAKERRRAGREPV